MIATHACQQTAVILLSVEVSANSCTSQAQVDRFFIRNIDYIYHYQTRYVYVLIIIKVGNVDTAYYSIRKDKQMRQK